MTQDEKNRNWNKNNYSYEEGYIKKIYLIKYES